MQISIEISLYPLKDNYEKVILDFIAQLNQNTDIEVVTNGMSTQVFGEYEAVMQAVNVNMKKIFEQEQAILVMKMGRGTLK